MLKFSKLEALGNDFVLVDARTQCFEPSSVQVSHLGDRRRGVGFDQLLILRESSAGLVRVDIHNQDGSVAEQCGNGMRAIARFLDDESALPSDAQLETAGGPVEISMVSNGQIQASLPPPDFSPPAASPLARGLSWVESHAGIDIEIDYVNVGNPHLVIELPDPSSVEQLERIGSALSQHAALANGANVNLAHVVDRHRIVLSVYERGVGPTLACGSGACATAVSLIRRGRVANSVTIEQPGGHLVIDWEGPGRSVFMTGPARRVFDGYFDPDSL